MEDLRLILDLTLAVSAAFAGGSLAQRFGFPVVLGYLAGGMVIGPLSPGPRADIHSVQLLAEIGIALLMFALGAEFSLRELRRLGRVALVGGIWQILSIMAVGYGLAPVAGLTPAQGVFLGALLALSSTIVAMKLLMGRGELQAPHGRAALGILLVQDMAVVPMAVVLPSLASGGVNLPIQMAIMAAKGGGVLLGVYLVGTRAIPWLFGSTVVPHTRELSILGIVALALGTALLTSLAGLSLAFGAFLAGLVVAESEYRTQVIADVLPLRDLFASLFFVSVGMLFDLQALQSQAGLVAILVAVAVVGKVIVVTVSAPALGLPARAAFLAGLSLAQVGEFSFLLAGIGVSTGALPSSLFSLMVGTVVVSIVLAPLLLRAGPRLLDLLERVPGIGGGFAEPVVPSIDTANLRRHTVICGFGRVGRELAGALERRGLPYLVIEYNPDVARELRELHVPVIYGDAGNPAVLEHAHLDRAVMLSVLVPDPRTTELVTRRARQMQPRLYIVARASDAEQVHRLQQAGASEVVQPEFEAGVEVIRHTMRRYGIGGPELGNLSAGRRAAFYGRAAGE